MSEFLVAVARAQAAGEEAACGPPAEASALCVAVFEATGSRAAATFAEVALVKPAKVALILVLAFVATRLLRRGVDRFVAGVAGNATRGMTARAAQRAETIGALLRSVVTFVVWTVALFMALGELGLNLGPLITGAGIVGIALGFGAQNLVRDFLSGIFMLMEDQYGVGDIIDAGPATGVVEAVTLRTTRLRDVNGVVWHIPNGTIERVGNTSQEWSRALLDVEVAYGTDLEFACAVIHDVARETAQAPDWRDHILEEPQVWGVERLGADGVTIRLVVKTKPSDQWRVARELRMRIKMAFDAAGIEIPFPQRTVWHRSADGGHGPEPATSSARTSR